MNKLEIDGVFEAVNGFAICSNKEIAYLYEPQLNSIISINLLNNNRTVLKWFFKIFLQIFYFLKIFLPFLVKFASLDWIAEPNKIHLRSTWREKYINGSSASRDFLHS